MSINQALLPVKSNSNKTNSLNCKFVKKQFVAIIQDIISGVLTYINIIL